MTHNFRGRNYIVTKQTNACSKSPLETAEKGVKYIQS